MINIIIFKKVMWCFVFSVIFKKGVLVYYWLNYAVSVRESGELLVLVNLLYYGLYIYCFVLHIWNISIFYLFSLYSTWYMILTEFEVLQWKSQSTEVTIIILYAKVNECNNTL